MYVNDEKNLYFIKTAKTEDGDYYLTPMHSIWEFRRTSDLGAFDRYYLFSPTKETALSHGELFVEDIRAIYVGPVENSKLVWEKGMTLPRADAGLESQFAAK